MSIRATLRTLELPRPAAPPRPAALVQPAGTRQRRAAVAIVLGADDKLLLIRRAAREGDPWSGDMAFPGGRHEAADPDDIATACRETFEEVGLDLARAHLVGALPVQHSPVRQPEVAVSVSPFLFRLPDWGPFTQSEEVAAVHLLDVDALLSDANRSTFRYQGWGVDRELPCIRVDGTFIWGLTLRMLDDLAEACGLPERNDWPGRSTG